MLVITPSSLALLLVVAAASSGSSHATASGRHLKGTTLVTNTITYTSYNEFAVAMMVAVNKQRATQGLSPLCLNKKLHESAQRHSNDMAAKDFMEHTGSDGTRMSERISEANYEWDSVAENIAAGQIDVDDVMVAWINSPHHLENIMGDYTMFGAAYAFNKDTVHQHFWTQDFGSSEVEACDGSVPTITPPTPMNATQEVEQEVHETPETIGEPTPVTVPNVPALAPAPIPAPEAPTPEAPAPVAPALPSMDFVVPVTTPSTVQNVPASAPTPAPEAPTPGGPAPEGLAPEGLAPEGLAPEGPAPEGPVPERPAPGGPAPETRAPLTTDPNVPVANGSTAHIPAGKVPVTEPLSPTSGPDRSVAADCHSNF